MRGDRCWTGRKAVVLGDRCGAAPREKISFNLCLEVAQTMAWKIPGLTTEIICNSGSAVASGPEATQHNPAGHADAEGDWQTALDGVTREFLKRVG